MALFAHSVSVMLPGATPYTAPPSLQVDLWSLGIILFELYVGKPPFYTKSLLTLINKIVGTQVEYPDSMSPPFKSFLQVPLAFFLCQALRSFCKSSAHLQLLLSWRLMQGSGLIVCSYLVSIAPVQL